ncbi:hypothetical protein HXA35_20120 [Bacillus sp. A301a_S52]|jgi:hypothetical protein|nr:hypothetical protein [Bacillus sp. A301a_S52]
MKTQKTLIIDPTKYYDSIIFKERDTEKIKANDFLNELMDMAFKVQQNNQTQKPIKEAN